jgi:hypothetical protein
MSNKLKKLFILVLIFISTHSYCQIKLFYDTANVINGNGIASLQNSSGINFGFETYRNYKLNGKYYLIDTSREYALKGELKYKPSCINYSSGVRITYLNDSDTLTISLDSALYVQLFKNSTFKVLKTENILVPEMVSVTHPVLNLGFNNPAVVPVGRWERVDLKRNYIFTQFDFDECGNTLQITYFNPNGSILKRNKYIVKSHKKRHLL